MKSFIPSSNKPFYFLPWVWVSSYLIFSRIFSTMKILKNIQTMRYRSRYESRSLFWSMVPRFLNIFRVWDSGEFIGRKVYWKVDEKGAGTLLVRRNLIRTKSCAIFMCGYIFIGKLYLCVSPKSSLPLLFFLLVYKMCLRMQRSYRVIWMIWVLWVWPFGTLTSLLFY